ncbi:MAG: oxaloacetate decarboxylase beta subunit, partial [Pseudohongiellaceae bacterium]
MDQLLELWQTTGIVQITLGQSFMIVIGLLLLYLAIKKGFEPLLLVPIGFGGILANIPGVDIAVGDGILHQFYVMGLESGVFPLLIFMGVGSMTDFGPLLANPKTLLLGAAAQFGIFSTLLGALILSDFGVFDFTVKQAAAIGIIGGADGPTAIYVSGILAPELLGAIAVAAYSYMALVPLIQPPIMRALTTKAERSITMVQLREVSQTEKTVFPILLLLLVALTVPSAAPLLGMFCFGNLMKECGVVT